jgi:predicted DNA-binding protein
MAAPKRQLKRRMSDPIPVRFPAGVVEQLDRLAPRIGGNRNTVIRLAVAKLLPEIESGRLILN